MTEKLPFIPYGRHFLDDADKEAVLKVVNSDWLTQGNMVARFEAALAERVDAKYVLAVTSGTAGLHLACLAAGLEPKQSYITSALTFVASANAPLYCGLEGTLGDVETDTLCMSARKISESHGGGGAPKMIVPVHFSGLSEDVKAIRSAFPESVIIEDACHGVGGQDPQGNNIGSCAYSDISVFSFHPVKQITCGEGGAVTTNNRELYDRLVRLRNQGIERIPEAWLDQEQAHDGNDYAGWYYEQHELGFNYRMTDILAALGLSQLDKLEHFTRRRREIALYYDQELRGVEGVEIAQSNQEMRKRSSNHLFVGLFDFDKMGCTRTQFMEYLRTNRIGSQVHYIPVYRQPFHQKRLGDVSDQFPNTEAYYAQALSLPLFPAMTDDDVEYVIKSIRTFLS